MCDSQGGVYTGIGLESVIMAFKRNCQHCGRPLPAAKRIDAKYCNQSCRRKQQRARNAAARRAFRWSHEYSSQSIRALRRHDTRTADDIRKARSRFRKGDLGESQDEGVGIYDIGVCRVRMEIDAGPILFVDTLDLPIAFD